MSDHASGCLCAVLLLSILVVLVAVGCESVVLILLARGCR